MTQLEIRKLLADMSAAETEELEKIIHRLVMEAIEVNNEDHDYVPMGNPPRIGHLVQQVLTQTANKDRSLLLGLYPFLILACASDQDMHGKGIQVQWELM